MSWGSIFKRVGDELEKRMRGEQQQSETSSGKPETGPDEAQSRYERLVVWIKTNYGNRFREGAGVADVEMQLQGIVKELEAKGAFKKHPKMINGFRAYINERKYGDLVHVTE